MSRLFVFIGLAVLASASHAASALQDAVRQDRRCVLEATVALAEKEGVDKALAAALESCISFDQGSGLWYASRKSREKEHGFDATSAGAQEFILQMRAVVGRNVPQLVALCQKDGLDPGQCSQRVLAHHTRATPPQ